MKRIGLIVVSLGVASIGAVVLLAVFEFGGSHQPTTALTVAAERGDASQVRKLIAAGADPNERDKSGFTPLIWATRIGDMQVARLLIEDGADLDERDCAATGWTPLIHAIHKNNDEMALLLLERGADVNARAGDCAQQKVERGASAIFYAAGYDDAEMVQALLDRGANPYDEYDSTTVLSNAVAGAWDVDRALNAECPTKTVKLLLERAPDLRLKGGFWDRKAMYLARHKGCTEIVNLLKQRERTLAAKDVRR